MTRVLLTVSVAALTLLASLAGYRFVRADVEAAVYRERLASLAGEYESLRSQYNDAVRRAAVTELLVKGDTMTVRVRTPAGALREIPTSLDPSREVFIDYVVKDGRVLIRRLFDDRTPPERGMVVDAELIRVDWDDPGLERGQTVYRRFTEGRWVVTVSGSGAMGLRRVGRWTTSNWCPPRPCEFETLDRQTRDELHSARGTCSGGSSREVILSGQRRCRTARPSRR